MRGGNPAPQIEWLLDNKNITKEVSLRDLKQSLPLFIFGGQSCSKSGMPNILWLNQLQTDGAFWEKN